MARKSRKNDDVMPVVDAMELPVYSTALYIRLSVEDNKKRGNSVESQISILENYIALNPELKVVDTYIDNGTTGTNFERAGFKSMMADVEAGKINCIMVKDLSRLGRNAIDTGYYIEKYFPLNNVRFISVNDRFDSSHNDNIHGGIILPMKNMINEAYSLDISRKIKAQAQQNMKDGDYIGGRPPYGYLKDPRNCHKLVIDPETAPVVKQIFEWAYYDKAGLNTIVKRLNAAGIVSPSHQRKQIGLITHKNLIGNGNWQTFTVRRILSNEIYTGDMVQGKTKKIGPRQTVVSKDKWIVVRDTHEAIISREIFDAVQEYREQVCKDSIQREVNPYTENIFKGKIFCAYCGKPLHRQRNTRKKGPDVYHLHCIANSRIGKGTCAGVMVSEREFSDKLIQYLCNQANSPNGESLLTRHNDALLKGRCDEVNTKIGLLKQDIGAKQRFMQSLYENLVKDVISKSDYLSMKADYESKITVSMNEITALESGLKEFEAQMQQQSEWADSMNHLNAGGKLTAELINSLIERIDVNPDKSIIVTCRNIDNERMGA